MTGVVVWFTGLPRSGKSTLAGSVRARLARPTVMLDGDEVRHALVPRPGYDPASRDHFYATLARLAGLLAWQGFVVLVPATANHREYRHAARGFAPAFIEVHVATPLAECLAHDSAGLYDSAAAGALPGAGVEYEAPAAADVIATGGRDEQAVARIVGRIAELTPAK